MARVGRAFRIDMERERWRVANARIAALEAENERLTAALAEAVALIRRATAAGEDWHPTRDDARARAFIAAHGGGK